MHTSLLSATIGVSVMAAVVACAPEPSQQVCTTAGRCFTIIEVGRQQGKALLQAPVPDGDFTVVSYASRTGNAPLAAATAEADSVAALALEQKITGGDRLLAIDQVTSSGLTGPLKEGRLYYYRVSEKSATRFELTTPAQAR